VTIQDTFHNIITSATNPVELTLGANPRGAALAGTLPGHFEDDDFDDN
jgi:hypothetical protein